VNVGEASTPEQAGLPLWPCPGGGAGLQEIALVGGAWAEPLPAQQVG
jgi:hypothetical protein